MRSSRFFRRFASGLVLLASATLLAAEPAATLADLLQREPDALRDDASRRRVLDDWSSRRKEKLAADRLAAARLGLPLRTRLAHGRLLEFAGFDEQGQPLFLVTHNADAATSSNVPLTRSQYQLNGSGITIGLWDGGSALATHQEFSGRVTVVDGSASDDHATHVAGTLAASGLVSRAMGMAPAASIQSFNWTSDLSEMTARAASQPNQSGRLYLSNHSYGTVCGWNYVNNATRVWEWNGNGSTSAAIEQDFGRYNSTTRDQDALAYSAPYYLIVRSAGNERNDTPVTGQNVALSPGSSTVVAYNPSLHPPPDSSYRDGYDTISFAALGKNLLTVGATTDAVTSGTRHPGAAAITAFSTWGPTDDGRIKPDLVANGQSVYSPIDTSGTSYATYSGTSMAAPAVTGAAALLIELYQSLFPGGAMRASTLKGLLIHTADDLVTPGPDYQSGWGLLHTLAAADLLQDHSLFPGKKRLLEDTLTTSAPLRSYPFTWDGSSPIRATLCWTDPAGTATSTSDSRTRRLVNDLNLRLIGPDGAIHLPWVMPFVGDWSASSMSAPATHGVNTTDNVEQVFLPSPVTPGEFTIEVSFSGTLTNSSQTFSLLLDGAADHSTLPGLLTLQSLSPTRAIQTTTTLTVQGSGFENLTAIALTREGSNPISYSAVNLQPDSLEIVFHLDNAEPGVWSLRLDRADGGTVTLPDALTIVPPLWQESFEPLPAGWTTEVETGSSPPTWTLQETISQSPPRAYRCATAAQVSLVHLVSPPIPLPSQLDSLFLRFHHRFNLENSQDGGRLQVSIDDGATWTGIEDSVTGASFFINGYNSTILNTGTPASRSPFAGLAAWSGNLLAFQETQIRFTHLERYSGRTLRLRWSLAANASNPSATGWIIDSIRLLGSGAATQPATITLSHLLQPYNGETHLPSAATDPAGLPVVFEFDSGSPPSLPGSYPFTATVTDPAYTATVADTLVIFGSTFDSWRSLHFSPEQQSAGLADPEADPDHDQRSNLLEYALHSDPLAFTPPLVPELDAGSLTLRLTRPQGLHDVILSAETSSNLADWHPIDLTLVPDPENLQESLEASAPRPSSSGAPLFIRLRATAR